MRHTVGKLLMRATTLLQITSRSKVCSQSYGAPKLWESRERKAIWMWAPWRGVEYTIRGEGGGFPQVRVVVSLVCLCCLWIVLAPKVLQLCTNHLVWVVSRPVWVSEVCELFLVPSRSSSTPLYPSKCCELRSVPRIFFLPLFFTWIHIWVSQGVGSASFAYHILGGFMILTWSKHNIFVTRFLVWLPEYPTQQILSHLHSTELTSANILQPNVIWVSTWASSNQKTQSYTTMLHLY
jgi:hypothetical protein